MFLYSYTINIKKTSLLKSIWVLIIGFSIHGISAQQVRGNSHPEIDKMVSKIDTTTDQDYIYDYKQTKYVPSQGKTLLIMGQTTERIKEYSEVFPNEKSPSGWSAYWGITEFKGVAKAHKNNTGSTQNHQFLIDEYPNTVIHSAIWMVGKWNVAKFTGDGAYDKVIKKYAAWAKKVNRPIFLRIGYEFDGPHNELEPDEYVKAYRRIVDLLRAKGANNIAFVWHSYASKPYKGYPISRWYPGDDYVNWVGISVFGHAYSSDFGEDCNKVLNFAKTHKKPVMIAEASPINGIDVESDAVWNDWFVNFFNFTYKYNIKAISCINEDWPALSIPGISEWKDSRIYNNKEVSQAWFKEINKPRYLEASPELFKQLGFED